MTAPTGRTFELRSLADLLDVPPDRLIVCVAELHDWILRVRQDIDADTAVLGRPPASIGPFIWTDDGTVGFTKQPRYLEREAIVVGPGYLAGNVNDTAGRFRDMSVREQHRRQAHADATRIGWKG